MQSFEDTRQKNIVYDVNTLVREERTEYNLMQQYMHTRRTCSICGDEFRLRYTMGTVQEDHNGRDHIDYDTESIDRGFELCVASNTFSVLNSSGYIPTLPDGSISESGGMQCIRRADRNPSARPL